MYTCFAQIMKKVKENTTKRIAVAAAADLHTIEAVLEARMKRIVDPIFVGNAEEITRIILSIGARPEHYTIVDATDDVDACKKAVALVREGKADFLMKGLVDTSVILREVVNKETGLSTGSVMNHVAIFEVPGYHKLMTITDGGMMPYPTLQQKKEIIENTVASLHRLGYDKPNVGVLTCVEKVNPKMVETVEADQLKQMYLAGEITGCVVEGPISYDCAVSRDIADHKGYSSPVAGEVDVFIVPNIHTGNVLAKSITCTAGGKMAGFIAGALCPIVLSSRGSSAEEKFLSILVSAAASN